MAKKKTATRSPKCPMLELAESLKAEATKRYGDYLNVKVRADMASIAYDNGASVESIAAKLGVPAEKVTAFFTRMDEVPIRELQDIATALNRQVAPKFTSEDSFLNELPKT